MGQKRLHNRISWSTQNSPPVWIERKSSMREVNFSASAFICAIETSNPSKLQVPRSRNTFDLSTSDLPPVPFKGLPQLYLVRESYNRRETGLGFQNSNLWCERRVGGITPRWLELGHELGRERTSARVRVAVRSAGGQVLVFEKSDQCEKSENRRLFHHRSWLLPSESAEL